MLHPLKTVLFTFCFGFVFASPTPRAMAVHERLETISSGLVHNGAAPNNQVLNLRLAFVQSDRIGLEDALMAVSTPGDAQYGKFLSKEEVEAHLFPCNRLPTSASEIIAHFCTSAFICFTMTLALFLFLFSPLTLLVSHLLFGAHLHTSVDFCRSENTCIGSRAWLYHQDNHTCKKHPRLYCYSSGSKSAWLAH